MSEHEIAARVFARMAGMESVDGAVFSDDLEVVSHCEVCGGRLGQILGPGGFRTDDGTPFAVALKKCQRDGHTYLGWLWRTSAFAV